MYTNFGSFQEIGTNFSLQLLSQIAKIKNKKVINENQCEKHNFLIDICCISGMDRIVRLWNPYVSG